MIEKFVQFGMKKAKDFCLTDSEGRDHCLRDYKERQPGFTPEVYRQTRFENITAQ